MSLGVDMDDIFRSLPTGLQAFELAPSYGTDLEQTLCFASRLPDLVHLRQLTLTVEDLPAAMVAALNASPHLTSLSLIDSKAAVTSAPLQHVKHLRIVQRRLTASLSWNDILALFGDALESFAHDELPPLPCYMVLPIHFAPKRFSMPSVPALKHVSFTLRYVAACPQRSLRLAGHDKRLDGVLGFDRWLGTTLLERLDLVIAGCAYWSSTDEGDDPVDVARTALIDLLDDEEAFKSLRMVRITLEVSGDEAVVGEARLLAITKISSTALQRAKWEDSFRRDLLPLLRRRGIALEYDCATSEA